MSVFRRATEEDIPAVYKLYKQAIGTEFCVWNESYPEMGEITGDLNTGNLFVLTEENRVIGALSVVSKPELDNLPCWRETEGTEIARVVVANDCRGKGLAGDMVQEIISHLRGRGCKAIRLSVAKSNLPARKTYDKAGFEPVGEAKLYGNDYNLMELLL